jgi:hypothetical protein
MKENIQAISEILRVYGQKREMLLPSELAPEVLQKLAADLTPITAAGFMREIADPESHTRMYEDVYQHIQNCDRLVVYRNQGNEQATAFLAVNRRMLEGARVYHLAGLIVSGEMQGNGFAKAILSRDMFECATDILAFHTQSKLMRSLGNKVSDFSSPLAELIATEIGTGNLALLPMGPIDRGRYGNGPLYGDIEAFRPIAVEGPGFDAFAGDAIVFAGFVRKGQTL